MAIKEDKTDKMTNRNDKVSSGKKKTKKKKTKSKKKEKKEVGNDSENIIDHDKEKKNVIQESNEVEAEVEVEVEVEVEIEEKKEEKVEEKKEEVVSSSREEEEEDDGIVTKSTFQELGVVESLCESCTRLKWTYATKIQKEVLPHALEGRDIIGLAETGSGKTGAFALPVLQGLLKNPRKGAVLALILAPTRELAFQIHECMAALGSGVGASCVCVVGGIDIASQAIALARNPHVVTATPGRLVDHLTHTKGFSLRNVQYLVMDEADRMLSMDFEEELDQILNELPSERSTMLFSATMTSKVQKLQRASLSNPVQVEVSTKFQTPTKLIQNYLFIPAKYKDVYLTYLINEHAGQKMLVFGSTCNNVQRIAIMLRNLGFPAVSLHGQMSQPKRLGALTKFKSGARDILICTDVASRGLDIPNVDVVINFDLPSHGKEYVHRVGRTARAGKSGKAIAIVTQYDVEVYQRLENLLQQKLQECKLDEQVVLLLHERVSEAQRLASRELKEQLAASSSHHGNRKRTNKHFDDATDDLQQQIKQTYRKTSSDNKGKGNDNQNRKKMKGWVGRGGQRTRY